MEIFAGFDAVLVAWICTVELCNYFFGAKYIVGSDESRVSLCLPVP